MLVSYRSLHLRRNCAPLSPSQRITLQHTLKNEATSLQNTSGRPCIPAARRAVRPVRTFRWSEHTSTCRWRTRRRRQLAHRSTSPWSVYAYKERRTRASLPTSLPLPMQTGTLTSSKSAPPKYDSTGGAAPSLRLRRREDRALHRDLHQLRLISVSAQRIRPARGGLSRRRGRRFVHGLALERLSRL